MLVEIPDPDVIVGFLAAFFAGLFGLYAFYKIKRLQKRQEETSPSSYERLEFYERQLIDMKIRLDSLELGNLGGKPTEFKEYESPVERVPYNEVHQEEPKPKRIITKPHQSQVLDSSNTVDFVLRLITDKSLTSRDIQKASQRSREHTSRLMKKLFQDGLVERNTKTKPYTYSITDKGRAKLGILDHLKNAAV